MTHVPGTVAAKYILHGLGRIRSPRVRLPLVGPEEWEAALIEDETRARARTSPASTSPTSAPTATRPRAARCRRSPAPPAELRPGSSRPHHCTRRQVHMPSHSLRSARPRAGHPARHPARRSRRDRPQHDRLRDRRQAAHRRLRRAVPRGAPAGRRPDPARLRADPATASTTSSASCSRTATRTTSARCRTCCRLDADIPLIGSKLTLALVEAKLKEHRIKPVQPHGARGQARAARPVRSRVRRGEPLDPRRARRRDPHHRRARCSHTGDFKMDQLPLDGRITDLRAFARLGEEGVDLFMVDSTNADVPGFTPLERDIGPVLDEVIARAPRRVIVASFSSHVHRVQQVLDAAAANDRRVALLGRSMVRNMTHRRRPRLPQGARGRAHRLQEGRRPPRRRDRLHVDRLAGRADGGARAHGEPRPPDRGRRGRHRHPRLEPHPGQRERRLPRDRRAHQARRQRRAQGQRQGARLRATPPRASCSTATTS